MKIIQDMHVYIQLWNNRNIEEDKQQLERFDLGAMYLKRSKL